MFEESAEITDALHVAMSRARDLVDGAGVIGFGVAHLRDGDGKTKLIVPFHNLITDAGDLYTAGKVIQGISPANATAPTAATGMKLGTGTTTASKSGAGAAIGTFLSGSAATFATSYPQTANLGAGLGVTAVYRCLWAAGVATTASNISEVAIVNDAGTNTSATSTAANTYSRALFGTPFPKAAGDSLQTDWAWKYLAV